MTYYRGLSDGSSLLFVVLNFIVDILYTLIDPRIELR